MYRLYILHNFFRLYLPSPLLTKEGETPSLQPPDRVRSRLSPSEEGVVGRRNFDTGPIMMNPPVLSVHDVSKEFGSDVRVLEHVDLEVVQGETLVLIGESGSGKTTLLRMFNGLTHPSSGEVRIHGEPIRVKDPIALRRHIGYVQQDAGLLPHWTVEENIGLVPLLLGWEPETKNEPGACAPGTHPS